MRVWTMFGNREYSKPRFPKCSIMPQNPERKVDAVSWLIAQHLLYMVFNESGKKHPKSCK